MIILFLYPCLTHLSPGRAFETPSGWALAVIRSVNPARKAVDGWKAVKHKGELLGNLLAQMHSDIDAAAAHAAVVAAAAAAADMDQAVGVHHSAAPPKPPTPSNRVPQQPAPRSLATHREDSGQSSDATTSNPSTHRRKRSKPCAAQ